MSADITLLEELHIGRPLHEVFAYVSDFASCEQWDPGVTSARRLKAGRIGVGTRYRVVCTVGPGRLPVQYLITEWETDKKVVLRGDCPFFTVTDTITFTQSGEGTRLDYKAEFAFKKGLAALAGKFDSAMTKMGKRAMAGLERALSNEFPAPKSSTGNRLADKWVLPGMALFTRAGYRLAKSRWHPLASYLGDKHIVLTGSTSGIGLAAAERLAAMGAQLTLVARNQQKATELAKRISRDTGNENIKTEIADLASLSDVHVLADRLLKNKRPIDVLVNNAGALINPRQTSAEGLEKSFALLLLSPFTLTERLQPLLKKAGAARVVNVVSGGMYSQRLDVDDLQNKRGKYSGSVAYAKAKRGLVIVTEQWADKWAEEGIVVNSMHPGWADTPGVESSLPMFHRLTKPFLRTPAEGADTIVWLAAAAEASEVSGQLFLDREPHTTHVLASTKETEHDRAQLRDRLLEYMESFQPARRSKRKTTAA
ncbi:MAG: SDR family NAD(P)-dependent oxidoreductase [Pseudomonadales bacterium]